MPLLKTLSFTLLLFLVFSTSIAAQDGTVQVTILNGDQIRCIDENTMEIEVTPNPNLTYSRIEIYWENGADPVVLMPGDEPLIRSHTYDVSAFEDDCTYGEGCTPGFNGFCFQLTVLAYYNDGDDENAINLITFQTPPEPEFSPSVNFLCEGEDFTLRNQTCPENDNNMRYYWTFPDGTMSQEVEPALNFPDAGTYNVTLTAANNCDSVTIMRDIIVNALPEAAAAVDSGAVVTVLDTLYNLCLQDGAAIRLNGSNSLAATTYRWDWTPNTGFARAGSDREPILRGQFTQPGIYTFSLTVDNPCGEPDVAELTVVVEDSNVSLDEQPDGCISLDYTPSPEQEGVSYTINGMPESNFPLTLGPGTYIVEALGSSSICQNEPVRDTFLVLTQETAEILTPDTTICALDGTFTFSATPENGIWRIDGTVFSGTLDPADYAPGDHIITYGNEPCITTDQITFTIVGAGLSLPLDQELCTDSPAQQFTAMPAGGYWTGTGIDSLGHFDPATQGVGTYVFTYTYNNSDFPSCSSVDSFRVTVSELMVDFMVESCEGNRLCFALTEESSSFQSITWDFGGTGTSNQAAPCHTFPAAGSYDVTVTIGNGACTASATRTIVIAAAPVAGFQLSLPPDLCAPLTVPVTNQATGDNLRYEWYLNGNLISENATIDPLLLDAIGETTTYTLRQVVSNDCATDSQMETIVVEPRPLSRFGIAQRTYCSGDTLEIANVSVGNPTSYRWFFNGVLISTDSLEPIITYQTEIADTVEICLETENICGQDTLCRRIPILPTDVRALFEATPLVVCVDDTIDVVNFATLGVPVFYEFGDGNTTANPNPRYSYIDTGTYLITQQAFGCGFDLYDQEVRVVEGPVSRWQNPVFGCPGDTLQFVNESLRTMSFQWDFGDGSSSVEASPRHVFPGPGTYEVCLTVEQTEMAACSDTRCEMVEIFAPPLAGFNITDSLCVDDPVSITSTAQGASLTCDYGFGDGDFSDECNDTHAYRTAGTFLVTQFVEDTNGCRDTLAQQVFVRPLPEPAFSIERRDSCHPAAIQLQNASLLADAYGWDFGDGNTSNATNPLHTYTSPGTYTITLTARRDGICSATTSQVVTIAERPNALIDIGAMSICAGEQIDLSSNGSGAVTDWRWSLGDGRTAFTETLTHAYAAAGNYTVRLEVSTAVGCRDTAEMEIRVFPPAVAAVSLQDVTCAGQADGAIIAQAISGVAPYSFEWSNGQNGESITGLPAGPYTLTLTDVNACQWDSTLQLTEPLALSAEFTAGIVTCAGGTDGSLLVEEISGGEAPYTFTWEDGSTDSLWTGLSEGDYTLLVQDARGCEQMLAGTVPENSPLTFALNVAQISCFGEDNGVLELDSIQGGIGPYEVFLQGNGLDRGGVGVTRFDSLPPGDYLLEIIDFNACQTVVEQTIVEPAPTTLQLALTDTIRINLGELIEFDAFYNATDPEFSWAPDRFLSCEGCPDPVAEPAHDITYVLTMTTRTNCIDRDTVVVLVDETKDIWLPNTFTPNADGRNDIFRVRTNFPLAVDEVESFQVLDRWGGLLFEQGSFPPNDPAYGWDGRAPDGSWVSPGVYVYQVVVRYVGDTRIRRSGEILLVR